jgi:predicted short-subunit dehydrogenase-like oxidoreductase (DUF2520 family)
MASRLIGSIAKRSVQDAVDLAEVVFITTVDDVITQTVEAISWRRGQAVIHCSGVSGLDLFDGIKAQGVTFGAFHPLQAFSSMERGPDSIEGITFAIEGSDESIKSYLNIMASDLKANSINLKPEDKEIYHVSGVMMGNLLTEYVAIASQLWEHMGVSREYALKALLPMMKQVTNNLEYAGIPGAIAGPYARGDVGTIKKHVEVLKTRNPDLLNFYCELALVGLKFAQEKGTLDNETVGQIRILLGEESGGSRS